MAAEPEEMLAPIVTWLDEHNLGSVYSAQSWNDLVEERSKEWWIAEGTEEEYRRLRSYLDATGLMDEYRIAESYIAQLPGGPLAVADLAAGVGWTSSLLSRLANVGSVHAVDISRHRLELLFPQAIRLFQGRPAKLTRHLGSFYELGFADASMDVVLLSAAFHHASEPWRLLTEIDRVLKPGGTLALIGEPVTGPLAVARRMVKKLLMERQLCTDFFELFPPDATWGDHYYRASDYQLFMQKVGYLPVHFTVQSRRTAVVMAVKQARTSDAGARRSVQVTSNQGRRS